MIAARLDEVEPLARLIGREVFARLEQSEPLPLSPAWFDDLLMQWTMSDEAVKVQLFRFIDALPALTHPEDVGRHLREYFAEAGERVPAWVRWGLALTPKTGWPAALAAATARWNAGRLARRFIAGSTVDEALATVLAMRKQGLTFTLDLLGEATITEAEADGVQAQYLELLDGLTAKLNRLPEVPALDRSPDGPVPRVNVSVKLSALYSQFDPIDPEGTSRAVRERLRPILRLARDRHAFVNFDMEQYAFKDATIRVFRDVLTEDEFRDWPDAGLAVQAYLRDTGDDLKALRDWALDRGTPVWVRLVKGAYWDYETVIAAQQGWPVPVFTEKWQSDANFETQSRFLLENSDWLRPAFGSHNVRSLANALALARTLDVPPGRYEFQMLYGMAGPIMDAFKSLGERVRVYTPYGKLLPGMAYLVRRLLENTSNDSFLRASLREQVPEAVLLRNPARGNPGGAAVTPSANGPKSAFRNEPLADFSREESRTAMARALEAVRRQFGGEHPLVIGGRDVRTDAWIEVRSPSHRSQVVGKCGRATKGHAGEAIAAAKGAFDAWADAPPGERAGLLRRLAAVIRRRKWELAAWACVEAGKPWREADADIAEAIDFCEYYAFRAEEMARGHARDLPGETNETTYEPRGVAVVIAPWNFPLAILTGMTTAALVTGNTVVMKPAEQSSVIAAKLMECLREAGCPAGVCNYLPGDGEEIGPTLVEHPDTAVIAFTGSLPVGLTINRQAADTPPGQDHIKRVIAELGGKNAIIVDSDADLDEAVKGVADSAFGYAGQKCSACSRAVVLEGVYDHFLERLVEAVKSMTVAPADEPGCGIGPVIDEDARRRILGYVEKGKAESRLAYAGDAGRLAEEGTFVAPHVFADVPPTAVIAQEEIFGPVLAVIKARDVDHALEIANGTKYALTGGVYSRSPETLKRVRRRLRVGNLYVNRKITGALVDRQPFGGYRLSGIGSKAGGPDYLLQFVVPRTVTENTMRRGFAPEAGAGE